MKKILLFVLFFVATVFNNIYADSFEIGPLRYRIDEAFLLKFGEEKKMNRFNDSPNSQYLAVRINVINFGNMPIALPPLYLIEDAKAVYEPTILAGRLYGYESLRPERLNPYARVCRWVFFDVVYLSSSKYELGSIINGSTVRVPVKIEKQHTFNLWK